MPAKLVCVHNACPTNGLPDDQRGQLFSFPQTDLLRQQWATRMNRVDLLELTYKQILNRGYRVCQLHFTENQFQTNEKKKLNFGQVPLSVFPTDAEPDGKELVAVAEIPPSSDPADAIPAPYPGSTVRGLRPNSKPLSSSCEMLDYTQLPTERLEPDTTTETDITPTKTTNVTTTEKTNLESPHQAILTRIPLHRTSQLTSQEQLLRTEPVNTGLKLITKKNNTLRQLRTKLNNITSRVHELKRITSITNSGERVEVATTKLTLEQRRKIAAWMEVFQSPAVVCKKYAEHFNCDPPSRLTISRIYNNFVKTGSVADDVKENHVYNDEQMETF